MNKINSRLCPCGSRKDYIACCEPFLTRKQTPDTAEALMRSRYLAYTVANIDYIKETMCGNVLADFQELDAKRWAKRVHWIQLKVFESISPNHVEFEASYVDGGHLKSIHENSEFIWKQGLWYYIGGIHRPTLNSNQMISRNMDCPCGSHRKFKNCHGI